MHHAEGPLVVDAHHLGTGQTGNETWTRGTARELARQADPGELVFAAGAAGSCELSRWGRPVDLLPNRSSARLAVGLPRVLRSRGAVAYLVHYTLALSRRPAVVVVHDLSAWHPHAGSWLSPRTRLRYRTSIEVSARLAKIVLVPSAHAREDLLRWVHIRPERVRIAPNAVDVDLAKLIHTRRPQRPRGGPFTVLAVGTVLPRKNLPTLARAVSSLREAGLDARLRLVGPVRPQGQHDAAEVRRLLGPHVTITGHQDQAALAREYLDADVLAFPSLFEGFGIPVLEAMAAGTPVCVSDRAALPEVAGGAGLVVPAQDPRAWAETLRRVQGEPGLAARLAAAGRARAAAFSWSDSAAVVLDSLREAAAPAPARGSVWQR